MEFKLDNARASCGKMGHHNTASAILVCKWQNRRCNAIKSLLADTGKRRKPVDGRTKIVKQAKAEDK